MSDAAGTDNPAFASEDECGSKTENGGQQQVTLDQDRKSSSADCAPVENGQRSFISQHYVEPVKTSSEPCYKTETKIELPAENTEKSVPEPKLNGVHGNGNNNDASFLNNSTTSMQVNESGKKEQIEAVNLELVSMRPYTGNNIQTKGQEACEVPADPYEEYFVPVNEHRKYIRGPEAEVETTVAGVRFDLGPGVGREGLSLRDPAAGLVDYSHWLTALRGEKLYVTKDKRSRNSYWKQLLCGFTILVVVIAMIIIVLAATGVIFAQEPTEPLENVKDPPSSPAFLTSTFPPWPTTDETLYQIIPDALDGTLRLDDFNWSNDLSDTKSRVYREITAEIGEHLGNILQRENNKPIIKVYNINNEGEIKFRISHPPMDTSKENQEYIKEALRKNNNMIGRYHLSRLQVENLIDQCEHGNLQCAESCKYDYSMGIFMCTCSPEKILDQDGKTCVDNDLSNVEMDDVMPQSSTESIHDFVQGRSRDPNTAQFEIRHSNMWENPDPKTGSTETETSTSEPKMEADHPQLEQKSEIIHPFESTPTTKRIFENHEHSYHSMETIFGEPAVEPESTAESEPTAEPEPIAEPESTAEPEPTAKPEPTAEPTAEPEPAAETEPTVKLIVPPESTQSELNVESEPTSEPVSEFSAKPEIVSKIESITEAESITEKETATEPVSVTESATTIDKADDDVISKTESHYLISTESHLESNIEISNQPESIIKSISHDDAESTQISLLEDANTTNVPKSLADLLHENNNSEIDKALITTMKTNENPIDDNISLQVIPLISKNKSIDTNGDVEFKMESTTMQSYNNEDDKINESTTIEASFTTLNYENLEQNNDENIISNKSRNHDNSNTEQFTQSSDLQEEKENDSTTEINLSDDFTISKELDSTIVATTVSTMSVENRTELIMKTTLNDKYFHTIEINGISNKNQETYNNSKVYETTMIPETTYTDMSTQPISDYQKEHVFEHALQSNTQDSNEKNVIEHMPTTVFPKVPKNFAHNVEPLKELITKPPDDEHIMLIPKSEEPVEIHAIIPQLIPEQSQSTQNESLKAENSTEINNGVAINEDDLNTKKSVEDVFSIDSSTMRNDKNIVHTGNNGYTIYSDEVQHSTNHPLHPAILPENSVNHFAGKSDANDDRHVEDMSPFLPDIHKEKENAKKAPRLDKDEQDVPNPFETHIDDVITHRPLIQINADDVKHKLNETETKDLLNDINLYSVNNERKTDITEETTKIIETNAANDIKNIIKNDLNTSEIVNDTESKIHNILHQDNNFAKLDNITEDAVNQKNSNSSVIEEDDDKALKAIASVIEDKTIDSFFQTAMQSTDNKTESIKDTTITAEKKVEDLEDSVIESGTTSLEKPEENAVEDQYNDITDESLSKRYRHDNARKDIPIKVVEESKKVILNNIDPIISYNRVPSSTTTSDIVKEKNETNMGATQSLLNTTVKGILEKQMEDAKLTTQEPVLPMEIQQEMSTTITTDKIEITTVIDNDKREENNREQLNIVRQSDEKEADKIAQITTTQSTLETKTTAQVPILPEELQTTENDILMTTSMVPNEEKEMNQETIDKTKPRISTENIMDETKRNITDEKENLNSVEINSTSSERSMIATTMYENNVNVESGREIGLDKNINDSGRTIENSTESAKIETTLMMSATEKNVLNGIEGTSSNDVTTTEDVRPVTEMLDDTQPETESYRIFITTPRPISIEPELSEEALRVIPLEKSQESKKKIADKKGFDKYKYKKEKDLSLEENNENNALTEKPSSIFSQTEPSRIITKNYEEPNDSIVSSDLDPSISRFNLFDREGNVLPILSKNTGNIDESSSVENKGVITETKPKNYPSFIPVSEEIIEPVPVTEPYIVKTRNYTRPSIVSSTFETEESTAVNETAIEGRTNDPETDLSHTHVRANETTRQPVTFLPDQSFGDAEEIDHVTKQLSTIRLTVGPITPMDMDVESATTVATTSFSGFASNAILSKCITDQFQCANGTSRDGAYCVSLSAKCDSKNDCSDGSDELNCEDCSGNFRCASGQCLKRHFVCNKIVDCDDGSDERDCENWKCQSDEFRCPSGRCIPASWQCNGRPDCEEYRDEYNCSESCKDNQYLCPTEKWCIPQTWRCNGIAECINEEDEKLCDCGLDQFECQTGGCISSIQRCDGVKNCPDYSDEWGCLITNITAETNINTENNMASEPSDRMSLLKIRQYDNDYRLVCSDGWSEEFSDSYCRTLGFAGAETTKNVRLSAEKDRSEKILRLKTNPNHRLPLVTNLEQVEFCVSDKVVQVSCQEFSCGLHDAEGSSARLSGGTPANDGQWPSVALLKELKHGTACTASILGPMHALASYSCIYRYKDSNRWQFFAGGDMLKGQFVKNIVPYPQAKYNQFLYNNDIALIELEEPLVFSRNISAVCLPRQPIQRQICVTAGWGFSMNGEIDLQQYLKFLSLPTYDFDKCNATSHYPGFITEHNICAGLTDTDKGPCYNDEGAPLMCASESQGIPERWEIQGLLSYHSRCSRDHPAIFSSLEPALSWLRESVPALQTQS